MCKYAKLVRIFLITLGSFTVLESSVIILKTVKILLSEPGNALTSVALVTLLLGMMLAVGGTCLAVRGRKYEDHRA